MIYLDLNWTSLFLAAVPGPSFDIVMVPVLFDILAFILFILGVAAFFWGRNKRGAVVRGGSAGSGGRRGIGILTGVTAILPVAWLLLVWTSVSTIPPPSITLKASPTQNIVRLTPTPDFVVPHTLTIGSGFDVISQTSVDGKHDGFDIELAKDIAQNMNLALNIVDSANQIPPDSLINGLISKKYDIVVSALRITNARKKQVDFVPYLNVGESLLVMQDNVKLPHLTKDIAELCGPAPGVRIGVRDKTTALTDLQSSKAKCKPGTTFQITAAPSTSEAIKELSDNTVDAVFQDSTITDYYINRMNPDGKLVAWGQVINRVEEGIAVRKGDKAMLQAIQGAYEQLKKDGTYNDLIIHSGFSSNEQLINNVTETSADEGERRDAILGA